MKNKFIAIKIEENDGFRIIFRLTFPRSIKKYFSGGTFYVEYDTDISNVSKSILYTPALAGIIHIAWAIGADVYVEEIDKTFLEAIEKIREIKRNWHPNFSFSTQVKAKKVVSNSFSNDGYGLLFSGGIDSTTSYIRNIEKKPHLISVWGYDLPPDKKQIWKKIEKTLRKFADEQGVKIHFIKTNIRYLIYERLLSVKYGLFWWERVSHGLTTIPLSAPLTSKENIGKILISSSGKRRKMKWPWGSHPKIDNLIKWADVAVIYDSDDLDRQEKIRHVIKPYINKTGKHPTFRVCTRFENALNCGVCEKCLRTIVGLTLENIDPNRCGFNIKSEIWNKIKEMFIKKELKLSENPGLFLFSKIGRTTAWKEIQESIPDKLDHNLLNSREFFEWFKNFDLEKYGLEMEKKIELGVLSEVLRTRLFDILAPYYHLLPKAVQNSVKNLYRKSSQK